MQVTDIQNNPLLRFYSRFDPSLKLHPHFVQVQNHKHRVAYTRFRCSSHHLAIETGRWQGQHISNRLCYRCRVIDDEDHFIAKCRRHSIERAQLSSTIFLELGDTSFKVFRNNFLYNLMKAESVIIVQALARYIYKSTKNREMQDTQ